MTGVDVGEMVRILTILYCGIPNRELTRFSLHLSNGAKGYEAAQRYTGRWLSKPVLW